MAIFIGNSENVTHFGIGENDATAVYIGLSDMIWPLSGPALYGLENVHLEYSEGNVLYASGSNYVVIKANVWRQYPYQPRETIATNATLDPIFVDADSHFWIYSLLNQIRAYDRGTVTGSTAYCTVVGTYTTPQGEDIRTNQITVTQEANSRMLVLDSATATMTFSPTPLPCTYSIVSVYPELSRTYHYKYTSGSESSQVTDHEGTAYILSGYTQLAAVTHQHPTGVTVGDNIHTLSSKTKTLKITYNGYELSKSFTHSADTVLTTSMDDEYYISIVKATDSISASGGYAAFSVSAGHTHHAIEYWDSDGAIKSDTKSYPRDNYEYTGGGDYFTPTVGTTTFMVSHDNMGTREETDSTSYTLMNSGKTTVTGATGTLSATNIKTVIPSAETTTDIIVTSITGKISPSGVEGMPIFGIVYYDYTTTGATFTSGSRIEPTSGSSTHTGIQFKTFSTNVSWAYRSGDYLYVDRYTGSTERSFDLTVTYDGVSNTQTFYQSEAAYITIADTYTTSGVSSTFYIPVSSNVEWTVSSNQTWCTVSNNNNTSVKVVVTANPSSNRQAIITLTGSGITARCTLTQTAAATITIYIKSNANTSSFSLYSGTGASGQVLVSGSISQGQTKTYTVPKDSVVKSWMVIASGLTYCNFAGTPGTQVYTGVWQNTNTSITLTDGTTYNIN